MESLIFASQKKIIQDLTLTAFAELTTGLFAAGAYHKIRKQKHLKTIELFPDKSSWYKSPTINKSPPRETYTYANHFSENVVTVTETIPCEEPTKLRPTEIVTKKCEVKNNLQEIPETEDSNKKNAGVLAGLACVVTSPTFLAVVGAVVVVGGAFYIYKKINKSETTPVTPNSRVQSNDNRRPHDPSSNLQRNNNRSRNSLTGNEVASSTGNGGNDQQPPSQNPVQTLKSEESLIDYFLKTLSEILKVPIFSLDQVSIRGQHIFRNLNKAQKNSLRKLIKALKNKGTLKRVLQTILKIFNTENPDDINFVNFLSWTEFIIQYLEESAKRTNQLLHDERDCSEIYNERREAIIDIVGIQIPQREYTILRVFREILAQIEEQILPVSFRNIHSAVYHYYKHRIVNIHELQVLQYYDIIQENLDLIMESIEYRSLLENGTQVMYTRYYAQFGRRLLIVLKKNGQRIDLSTCYFIDEVYDDDNDGDTYINGNYYKF